MERKRLTKSSYRNTSAGRRHCRGSGLLLLIANTGVSSPFITAGAASSIDMDQCLWWTLWHRINTPCTTARVAALLLVTSNEASACTCSNTDVLFFWPHYQITSVGVHLGRHSFTASMAMLNTVS